MTIVESVVRKCSSLALSLRPHIVEKPYGQVIENGSHRMGRAQVFVHCDPNFQIKIIRRYADKVGIPSRGGSLTYADPESCLDCGKLGEVNVRSKCEIVASQLYRSRSAHAAIIARYSWVGPLMEIATVRMKACAERRESFVLVHHSGIERTHVPPTLNLGRPVFWGLGEWKRMLVRSMRRHEALPALSPRRITFGR